MRFQRAGLIYVSVAMAIGASTAVALQVPQPPPDVVGGAAPWRAESSISSNGTARVERAPEHVDVFVGVVSREKTASEAQRAANAVMDASIKALEGLKLAGSEVQTGRIELSPQYDRRDSEQIPRIIAYEATMTLRVRTTDLTAVAKVIDTSLASGCNQIERVEFGIKESLEAREEAIRLATQAAKRKAGVIAEALGLKLVRVTAASTHAGFHGVTYSGNYNAQVQRTSTSGGGGERDGTPVVPGKVQVWAEANISFAAAEGK